MGWKQLHAIDQALAGNLGCTSKSLRSLHEYTILTLSGYRVLERQRTKREGLMPPSIQTQLACRVPTPAVKTLIAKKLYRVSVLRDALVQWKPSNKVEDQ